MTQQTSLVQQLLRKLDRVESELVKIKGDAESVVKRAGKAIDQLIIVREEVMQRLDEHIAQKPPVGGTS